MLILCLFMLINVKIIKKKIYDNFMLIYLNICKYHRQTDKHIKSISEPHNIKLKKIGLTLLEINVICEVPFYKLNFRIRP